MIVTLKMKFLTKTDGYQKKKKKKKDINKNATKIGVIIKGVYYIWNRWLDYGNNHELTTVQRTLSLSSNCFLSSSNGDYSVITNY